MLIVIPTIISKYAAPALFGAATKTYLDYKRDKVSAKRLLVSLLLNSIFAVGFGAIVAHAFANEYPDKEHLTYAVAYFAGAVGINILSGLLAINWEGIINTRLGGK